MKVILDALIPRDDFEVVGDTMHTSSTSISTLSVTNLKKGDFFLSVARKPDFQRETNEWDSKKIIGLINSFIDGDLIPAIILWQSPRGYTFVIDGAHRLSALTAWINDDYGDGLISKDFFSSAIPEEQLAIAERTRKAIRKQVGSFADFELAMSHPEKVHQNVLDRSKLLASRAVQVQWVIGDARKAEDSFFRINQEAVAINSTELKLLQSRKKPDGISARAISRSGTGHKYWSGFKEDNQRLTEEISKEINKALFSPPLKNPVKTLDLPIGGKLYSQQTLALILELTHIANDFKDELLHDDTSGDETVKWLANTRKIVRRINTVHPSSLGLHPAVYFYSADGRYKPASFYIVTLLMKRIESSSEKLRKFIEARSIFENWLLTHDYYAEQILRRARFATLGYPTVVTLYEKVIELAGQEFGVDAITRKLEAMAEYSHITKPTVKDFDSPAEFSSSTKSAVFIKEAISQALKCNICNGYIHMNSITFDHELRKSEGGLGIVDNGKLTHPYCNTTYKN